MRKFILLVVLLALLVSVAPALAQVGTVVDVADANDDLNTFASAVYAAGLANELAGPGPFTVFAPTDAAFRGLPTATLEALNSDPAALANLLLYHLALGTISPAALPARTSVSSLLPGGTVAVSTNAAGTVFLNGSARVVGVAQASNGVIYLIDEVLAPPVGAQVVLPLAAADGNATGLDDQVVIVGPGHIYIDPKTHGNQIVSHGHGFILCERAHITEIWNGYAKLRDQGGWIGPGSFAYPGAASIC